MPHIGLVGLAPNIIYFGGIVAFLASVLWSPSIGLYVLVFVLPMQTLRYRLQGMPLGDQFVDILLLGVTIGLLVRRDKFEIRPLGRLFLLFALFCFLSLCLGSFYLGVALPLSIADPRFSDWKNYVEMFFLCLVVVNALKNPNQIKWLLVVMCVSFLLVNRSFYSTMSGRDLSRFSYDTRDAGPLGYAGENGFAAFEAMFTAFLVGVYAYERRVFVKLGLLGLMVTGIYCLLFSYSRGGYLGFLAALVVAGILKERKLLVLVAVLLIAWQTLLPRSVQERITMTTEDAAPGERVDSSAEERIRLWEDAINLLKQNPITGTGFDTYRFLDRVGPYRDTHNYYMKVLVETGVVGLCLFLWLLSRMWRMGLELYRSAQERFWSGIGLGFLALMASATVGNLFGDRWTYQQLDGFMWVLLGCVIRGLVNTREACATETEAPFPKDIALAASV